MANEKVFMFPEGGSNSSIDPALLMALNNNGGFGGNGAWLWIIFLFFLYPMFRNGGFFGNNGGLSTSGTGYLANMANNDVGREMLMSAIQGNGNAISNLATTLGCNVDSVQAAINGVMNASIKFKINGKIFEDTENQYNLKKKLPALE